MSYELGEGFDVPIDKENYVPCIHFDAADVPVKLDRYTSSATTNGKKSNFAVPRV